MYAKFRFGILGFVSVNPTEISVSVVSVFTRFGRPLTFVHLSTINNFIFIIQKKIGPLYKLKSPFFISDPNVPR